MMISIGNSKCLCAKISLSLFILSGAWECFSSFSPHSSFVCRSKERHLATEYETSVQCALCMHKMLLLLFSLLLSFLHLFSLALCYYYWRLIRSSVSFTLDQITRKHSLSFELSNEGAHPFHSNANSQNFCLSLEAAELICVKVIERERGGGEGGGRQRKET